MRRRATPQPGSLIPQDQLPHLDLVPVLEDALLLSGAVHQGPVGAAQVLDEEGVLLEADGGVGSRDGGLRQNHVRPASPADHQPVAVHGHLESLIESPQHADAGSGRHRATTSALLLRHHALGHSSPHPGADRDGCHPPLRGGRLFWISSVQGDADLTGPSTRREPHPSPDLRGDLQRNQCCSRRSAAAWPAGPFPAESRERA